MVVVVVVVVENPLLTNDRPIKLGFMVMLIILRWAIAYLRGQQTN